MSYKKSVSKTPIKKKLLLTRISYKKDINYKKLMVQMNHKAENEKSILDKKNDLKKSLQIINNEIHFTNEPIIKSLHESNINFKNEYKLFNKKTHKKETKEIFKDLVKLYQHKGYHIPNFSINDHNLFKINPLIEENPEKMSIGILENQMGKKRHKDNSEKVMEYLKKLSRIISEKMSLESETQRNLFEKFTIPKLKVKASDEDDIEILKKKIEIINNLINTDSLSKLDDKSVKNLNYFHRDSIKSSHNLRLFLKNNVLSNKQKDKLFQRRLSNFSVNFSPFDKNENNIKEKNSSNKERKLSINTNDISILSNKNTTLNITQNQSSLNNNKSIYKILQPRKKTFNIDITKINDNFKNKSSDKKNNSYRSSMTINHGKTRLDMSQKKSPLSKIQKNKKQLATTKNAHFGKFPLFIKTQTKDYEKNDYSDEYALLSPSTNNKNRFCLKHRKTSSYNFPYSEKEYINYAFEKLRTRKNLKKAETMIKNYLNKAKGYDNEKTEDTIKEIYSKSFKNNVLDLKLQILHKDICAKTERLYVNNHIIKRIKPVLDNMFKKDTIIERFDKSFTNVVSCK